MFCAILKQKFANKPHNREMMMRDAIKGVENPAANPILNQVWGAERQISDDTERWNHKNYGTRNNAPES